MLVGDNLAIVILGLTFGAQLVRRSFLLRAIKWIFFLSAAGVLSASAYFSFLQYRSWQGNPLTEFFLPPYQNLNYFLSVVGTKIFSPWLISLLAAIVLAGIAEYLNRKYGERFFHNEEIWLMRIGIFLTGYPGFLLYLILVLLSGLLFSILYSLFSRGRASLYYFWMPIAMAVILFQGRLVPDYVSSLFSL